MRIGLIAIVVLVMGGAYLVLSRRGGPPDDLSAGEAVDLALFQTWTVAGAPANIAHPTEVFVTDLDDRDAEEFLHQKGAPTRLPAGGLAGFISRRYIVVARGPVTAGPDAATRAQGLALVIDRAGAVQYVGIGLRGIPRSRRACKSSRCRPIRASRASAAPGRTSSSALLH